MKRSTDPRRALAALAAGTPGHHGLRQRLRRRPGRHRPAERRPGRPADPHRLLRRRRDQGGQRRRRRVGERAGNTATVTPAQDLAQQLGQALAGGTPPDVFYVDAAPVRRLRERRRARAVRATRSPTRTTSTRACAQTFTYDGKLYCVPKDFSTLALQINTDLWTQGRADRRRRPDDLGPARPRSPRSSRPRAIVAAGHRRHPRPDRRVHGAGRRLDRQRGRHAGHRRHPGEPRRRCRTCRACSRTAWRSYPKQVDAGWGGEAFGKGKAAMTIEGNWIKGALKNDFPDVKYTVHELPAGPAGKGTLSFTTAGASPPRASTRSRRSTFVEAMTTADQQLAFAKAFGVMPSRQSARGAVHRSSSPSDKRRSSPAPTYAPGPGERARRWTASWPTSTASCRAWPPATRRRSWQRLQTSNRPRRRSSGVTRDRSGRDRLRAVPAEPPQRRGGIRGNERHRRLALRRAGGASILGPVPAAADPHGAVGQPHRLERPGQPVHRRTCRSSALDNYTEPVHRGRPDPRRTS